MLVLKDYLFLLICLFLVIQPSYSQIEFEEVGENYGVQHSLGGPTIGGGVSLFDFNQDGLDDLTLATHRGSQIGFYQNNGSGFTRITPLVSNTEIVKQINWVDFDNDGDPDLYVSANEGVSRLYLNEGDLILRDITEESGLPLNFHYGYGACWGDYNRDGWLDLYYASKGIIGFPDSIRSYNRLFQNMGDGTFVEKTESSNSSDDGKLPFCAAFLDYNNDMWPDIYIANDKLTHNTLLKNNQDGTFADISAISNSNARMNAMCVNPGDYDRDGWMDIYVTNTPVGSQCLKNGGLQIDEEEIKFLNVAEELEVHFPGGNCWGSNFLDADNDGDLDLYVSSSIDFPQELSSSFFENIDGQDYRKPIIDGFSLDASTSYTNAIGDINNDGKIDIIVENNPPYDFFIWENKSEHANHWLKIDLEGVLSNRDGVGVRIESYINELYQMQFTLCGSGFLGQNSSYKHIGLGENPIVDSLVITWPTGHIDRLYNIQSDQLLKIVEGSSTGGEISIDDNVVLLESSVTTATSDLIFRENQMSMFPNPSLRGFNVTSVKRIVQIDLINNKGQLVMSQQATTNTKFVDASKLEDGLYFVRVSTSVGQPQIIKWIKM